MGATAGRFVFASMSAFKKKNNSVTLLNYSYSYQP